MKTIIKVKKFMIFSGSNIDQAAKWGIQLMLLILALTVCDSDLENPTPFIALKTTWSNYLLNLKFLRNDQIDV